jgi:rubrerythrin
MLFCFNAGEVFQVAVEIEKNGISFYNKAQKVLDDPELKQLFSTLAKEEEEHKRRFEEFQATLPEEQKTPVVSDPENELDVYLKSMADQHIFGAAEDLNDWLAEVKSATDAVKLALQFEKDSVIFYLSMLDATCEGKARDLVNLLIKEGQDHVRRLSLQLRRCSSDAKACVLDWPRSS